MKELRQHGNIGRGDARDILSFFARFEKGHHSLGKYIGLFDTVVERDAVVCIAAEEKSGKLAGSILDPCHLVEMTQAILRDGLVPTNDGMERGVGGNVH